MKYELMAGRPASDEGRTEKELRVYGFLDALGISYWRTDHPDAEARTMEDCRGIDAVLQAAVCKNLFLTNRQHTSFYLLMLPGEKPFRTRELSAQIGSARLSFGTPEEMEEMTGCAPGSASVLGLMNDAQGRVQLLVDRELLAQEFIGCHPCVNTSSLKIRTRDIFGPILAAAGHKMLVVDLAGE